VSSSIFQQLLHPVLLMRQAQLIREQQKLREQEEERLRKEEEERVRKEEEAERLKEEKVIIVFAILYESSNYCFYSICRVRTILVLGYWVLGNIHRYWVVLLLGDIFWLFWHPMQYQSDSQWTI